MKKIDDRIAHGVALLDAKYPEWYTKIDLDKLDMASVWSCVLGQTFGGGRYTAGYYVGLKELDFDYDDTGVTGGFAVPDDTLKENYFALTERWKRTIRRLRKERGA